MKEGPRVLPYFQNRLIWYTSLCCLSVKDKTVGSLFEKFLASNSLLARVCRSLFRAWPHPVVLGRDRVKKFPSPKARARFKSSPFLVGVPCWGPAPGGDVPEPPAHSSQLDILVDPIFIQFGPASSPTPQFIPPRGSSPPTLHLPAAAPASNLCFLAALRMRAERAGLHDGDCDWHGASGARIRVSLGFPFHFDCLCSWASFTVCGWGHSPCCLRSM